MAASDPNEILLAHDLWATKTDSDDVRSAVGGTVESEV